jgi:DNA-binding response OmpR family regulator
MTRTLYVIMVQTDEDDRFITESALKETGTNVDLKFVPGLDELDKMVSQSGLPALILLSDRGAISKAVELVIKIRRNFSYTHIPVIVLGEVTTEEYVKECYNAGANSYIIKPSSTAETKEKIETFFRYWFEVAEL